ncbi:hypothetical protein Hanom_Chr09g00777831 [Helianthus anomalus]
MMQATFHGFAYWFDVEFSVLSNNDESLSLENSTETTSYGSHASSQKRANSYKFTFAGAILGYLAMAGLMIVKMKTHRWVCKMMFKTQIHDGVEKSCNMAKVINSRWVGSKWARHFNAQKGNTYKPTPMKNYDSTYKMC